MLTTSGLCPNPMRIPDCRPRASRPSKTPYLPIVSCSGKSLSPTQGWTGASSCGSWPYTGMRSHVQVKARAEKKLNSDGSISYSADASNINYLLNGLSPLYVLYLADERELRYAWVRDEVNRIERETSDWKRQKTVTLRFTAMLDEAGLQDIHDCIRREARLDREIHDLLSRADVTEKTLHVNLKESKVTDPDKIRDLLLEAGLTLVSSGDAAGVLEAIDKLSHADRKLPRLLLVRAFAECSLGHYQAASALPGRGECPGWANFPNPTECSWDCCGTSTTTRRAASRGRSTSDVRKARREG